MKERLETTELSFFHAVADQVRSVEVQVDVTDVLGRGSYGVVFAAQWRGASAAAKIIKFAYVGLVFTAHDFTHEVEMQTLLGAEDIMPRVWFSTQTEDAGIIVMERMDSTLTFFQCAPATAKDIRLQCLAYATRVQQKYGLVTDDIHDENIMVSRTNPLRVRLIDAHRIRLQNNPNARYLLGPHGLSLEDSHEATD